MLANSFFLFFLKEVSLLIKSLPSHTYAVKCKGIPSSCWRLWEEFPKKILSNRIMGTFCYFMRNEHTPLMGEKKAPEQASRWTWKWNCFYLPVISCSCWPQFFLKESHLGQNRATCSLQQLSDLNPRVRVSAHTGPLDDDLLLQFQVCQALSVAPNCASGFMLLSIKITKLEDYLFVYFCLIISNLSTKILKHYVDSFFLIEGSKIYPNIFHVKSLTAGQKLFSVSL